MRGDFEIEPAFCAGAPACQGPLISLQVELNQQIVISQEQLEQIRQLRGAVVYEAPGLEGPPQPFPASSGSVGYEVKVTP